MRWSRARTGPSSANTCRPVSITANLPEGHRLWAHRGRPCRGRAEVLYSALEPLLELSSAVRIRDGELGCARETAAAIQEERLRDAGREMEVLGGSGAILEAEPELCAPGRSRVEAERPRAGVEECRGASRDVEALQDRSACSAGARVRTAVAGSHLAHTGGVISL